MSVGAIRTDGMSNPLEAGNAAARMGGGFAVDFGTLMSAALLPASDGGVIAKAEVSRCISIAGGICRTVITYADGSSDIQIGAAASDRQDAPFGSVPSILHLPQTAFRADSDLEPEAGAGHRAAPDIIWRPMINGRMTTGLAPARTRAANRISGEEQSACAAREPGVGRLIDMMV